MHLGKLIFLPWTLQYPILFCVEDRDLVMTRYRHAYAKLECADGCLVFKPGCGGLQGDTFMVVMWLNVFAPIVGDWQVAQLDAQGELSKVLHCRSPNAELVDGSITVYADDLAKLIALQPPWLKQTFHSGLLAPWLYLQH